MKTKLILMAVMFAWVSFSAYSQTQTLVTTTNNNYSSIINVSSNYFAVVKSVDTDDGGSLLLNIQGIAFTKNVSFDDVSGMTIYGPATIQLEGNSGIPTYASVEVGQELEPVAPNQTQAIGSNAGNVEVTLQTSTDLVNWTNAVSGTIYSNSPDARFFRIELQSGF
jgi:hypothetical protein